MNIDKLKKLTVGSKLKINGVAYVVKERCSQASADIKEWKLLDKEEKEYLLQLITNDVSLWRWEINPKTKKVMIDDNHWIFVETVEC